MQLDLIFQLTNGQVFVFLSSLNDNAQYWLMRILAHTLLV